MIRSWIFVSLHADRLLNEELLLNAESAYKRHKTYNKDFGFFPNTYIWD